MRVSLIGYHQLSKNVLKPAFVDTVPNQEFHLNAIASIYHCAAKSENSQRTDASYPVIATTVAPLVVLRRFSVLRAVPVNKSLLLPLLIAKLMLMLDFQI